MERRPDPRSVSDYVVAVSAVAAALMLSLLVQPWLPLANLSLVFLLGVLWVSVRASPLPALFAALLSALA